MQAPETDFTALTDSCILLRKEMLDLVPEINRIDAYTKTSFADQWNAERQTCDNIVHFLNKDAVVLSTTLEGYLALLPDASSPEMEADLRIELQSLCKDFEKLSPSKDQTPQFKELANRIKDLSKEIGDAISTKNSETDIYMNEASDNLQKANAVVEKLGKEVQKLQLERATSHGSEIGNKIGSTISKVAGSFAKGPNAKEGPLDYKKLAFDVVDSVTSKQKEEPADDSEESLRAARSQLEAARANHAKAEGEVREKENIDWTKVQQALKNVRSLIETVSSKHLISGTAEEKVKNEIQGYLAVLDASAADNGQANQRALMNYHRKAKEDGPRFEKLGQALKRFAYELK